ncbi:MAG: hypothetical protein IJV54_13175 [Bacteroidales bacterium]|nr:hypothetical protein [Bacteroidales bacterium]MBR1434104.1 hypothetical protein [Bacteroidales bacterium]
MGETVNDKVMIQYMPLNGRASLVKRISILLSLCFISVTLSSCVRQKTTVTVHYEISNSSGVPIRVNSPYRDFALAPDGKETFTDVREGIDYYGSCNFGNVFEDGFTLTIDYKDKEYTLENTHDYSRLWNFGYYSIRRISPGEFSVSYSFSWSEIFGCLSAMGVEIEEQYYYPDYPYGE